MIRENKEWRAKYNHLLDRFIQFFSEDGAKVARLEKTNRQLCFNLDEAQKVAEARDEQAAIDKDFIRQYQAQVEALQEEKESLIEQRAVMRRRIESLVKMLPRGRREP